MKYLIAPHQIFNVLKAETGLDEYYIRVLICLYYAGVPYSKEDIYHDLHIHPLGSTYRNRVDEIVRDMRLAGDVVMKEPGITYHITGQGCQRIAAIQAVLMQLKRNSNLI